MNECNKISTGHCGVCGSSRKCIQMNCNFPKSSEEQLHSNDESHSSTFSKQIFEEIETQSRLSNEHLSMKDSIESIIQSTKISDCNDVMPIEDNKNKMCMKILYERATPEEYTGDTSKLEYKKKVHNHSREFNNVKQENVFLFDEDSNDFNDKHISEIRFMDSTESLKNFLSNTKPTEKKTSISSNNGQHPNSLSFKVLHDFEHQNATNSKEVVKNYFETYSPTKLHNSPSYNCQFSHCDFNRPQRKPKIEIEMKTVSVSTESEPSLKSNYLQTSDKSISTKFKAQDYLIMQAIGIPEVGHNDSIAIDKNIKPNIDIRMEKILKTLREDPTITKFEEKPNFSKHQIYIPEKQQEEKVQINKNNSEKDDKNIMLLKHLLNTYRAVYSPPNTLLVSANNLHSLPQPQFQTIPCTSALASELLQNQPKFLNLKPVPACILNIPRSPIKCPETTCQRTIFVSDFNKHLVVDHTHLPMERIMPFQCKNFFLDARLAHDGTSKCHLLYLLRDKITNLGSSEYKDFIPLLVMTTRITLNEMCGLREKTSALGFFLIWVTGIAPEEFPISVSITVWSRSGRVPSCHVVYSGQMYSIRESQRALDVWQSGRLLLLTDQEIKALTCNGKEMLNLQLSVH